MFASTKYYETCTQGILLQNLDQLPNLVFFTLTFFELCPFITYNRGIICVSIGFKLPFILLFIGIGLILSGMYAMEISKFTINSVKGSYVTYDRWFQLSITVGICCSSLFGIDKLLGKITSILQSIINWKLYQT